MEQICLFFSKNKHLHFAYLYVFVDAIYTKYANGGFFSIPQ